LAWVLYHSWLKKTIDSKNEKIRAVALVKAGQNSSELIITMDNKSKDLSILIEPDNFESEVTNEKRPVLLSFIHRDLEFETHITAMEGISKRYADTLKVCVLDAEFIGPLGEKLGVDGTPTFLVLAEGKEKSRMLGQADNETLEAFLSQALTLITPV